MFKKLNLFHKKKFLKDIKQGYIVSSCSLVFPCYNEEKSIESVLNKALKAKELLASDNNPSIQLEIIVVNDGSTDNSQEILDIYKDKIKVLNYEKQRGYGAALKEGFSNAEGNFLSFCDLDSTCEPQELRLLIKTALKGNIPVVWGNRIHPQSSMPFIRRTGNRLFSLILCLLSGRYIVDPCSGFRVFKKDHLVKNLFQFPDDFSFSLALTTHCIREKIPFAELVISYNQRQGKSKLQPLKDGFMFLKTIADILIFKRY